MCTYILHVYVPVTFFLYFTTFYYNYIFCIFKMYTFHTFFNKTNNLIMCFLEVMNYDKKHSIEMGDTIIAYCKQCNKHSQRVISVSII